ncbi:unnamed protein product [Rotaria sp. Silwood2]|nr:unnamed protein product [Rotaria sp. Silwood2]CAF2717682.1 unnamed protein product [Rotaria sp. Silwood2]CAF2973821.1 unnamed protein product [Rotaria sp. Silwood2]CAF3136644.1 unnamed protein product [Rotaria sp. Silwood2]CAF3852823.1 unnamed protein product [Rotaria sp. Silwood2]
MHLFYLLSIISIGFVYSWPDPSCRIPPLAANYTIEKYSGRWFEIGKIQTPGGAFFEKGCVCTHIDVNPTIVDPTVVNISNICNKDSPDGKLIVSKQTLTSSTHPSNGRYNASFLPDLPPVAYNVIVLKTDDYSVEYDCIHQFGITNYCVHILSRKPTLDTTIVNSILKLVQELDLNTAKIEYKQTQQENCSYPK